MSRTFRRKTRIIKSQDWVLRDWNNSWNGTSFEKHYFTKDSKEGKKAIAEFHSDAGCGDLWYKSHSWAKFQERRNYKRRCTEAIHRYFNGIDEDCVLPTYKHEWLD